MPQPAVDKRRALALLATFVAIELRARRPLAPLGIFRNRALRGANLVSIAMTMAFFPMFFFLTFYTQQVLGYEPIEAGFAQLPIALSIILFAGVASQIVTRAGYKTTLVTGMLVSPSRSCRPRSPRPAACRASGRGSLPGS
jgi:Na+/melibiose symporter-like transporter